MREQSRHMNEAKRPVVDLRARIPEWLDHKLRKRAAQRLQGKSEYVRQLILADVNKDKPEREEACA
jgi:hypothetical protein